MKTRPISLYVLIAAVMLMASPSILAQDAAIRTFCRFVPERSDDFAWENDKIAFRAYGPALRDGTENGGVDCWLKRVDYPIIDKWYKKHVEGGTYHADSGEGYDPYHVGSSLGCGGIGLWLDGKLVTTETFTGYKVIQCEPEECVFNLDYEWEHAGHDYTMTKRITIRSGDRLFESVSTFRRDGKPAVQLPVAIGLTTHEGKARVKKDLNAGWIACWEEIDGSGLGTGVVMDPKSIEKFELIESEKADESHALFLAQTDDKGQVIWWAGYGWERAGEIKTKKAWEEYLTHFNGK